MKKSIITTHGRVGCSRLVDRSVFCGFFSLKIAVEVNNASARQPKLAG